MVIQPARSTAGDWLSSLPAWQQWLIAHEWQRRVEAGEISTSDHTRPAEIRAVLDELQPALAAAQGIAAAAVEAFHGERFDEALTRLQALVHDPLVASLALLATVEHAAAAAASRRGRKAASSKGARAQAWVQDQWDRRAPGQYAKRLAFGIHMASEIQARFGVQRKPEQIADDWVKGRASLPGVRWQRN